MSYDLEEQDQIAQLRDFWERWGNLVTAVLLVAALAWAGWAGWQRWQLAQAGKAGALYAQLEAGLAQGRLQDAAPIADKLRHDYASSAYAGMGALAMARADAAAGQGAAAQELLSWAAAHAAPPAYRAAAMLDLAALQIDAGKYDAALATVAHAPVPAFDALFAARRGDVELARGDRARARDAYKQALLGLPPDSSYRAVVQIKLQSVGGLAS